MRERGLVKVRRSIVNHPEQLKYTVRSGSGKGAMLYLGNKINLVMSLHGEATP